MATSDPLPPISKVFNAAKQAVTPQIYKRIEATWAAHNKTPQANASATDATCADDSHSGEDDDEHMYLVS